MSAKKHVGGLSSRGLDVHDENSDLVIEPGMVFTIQPRVPIPGGPAPNCQIRDAVPVTATGVERPGRRRLEAMTLG